MCPNKEEVQLYEYRVDLKLSELSDEKRTASALGWIRDEKVTARDLEMLVHRAVPEGYDQGKQNAIAQHHSIQAYLQHCHGTDSLEFPRVCAWW